MTNLLDTRRGAVARLSAAGVPDAVKDAAALLAFALGIQRADLALLSPQTELTDAQHLVMEQALVGRTARQPLSQIIGQRLFWGRAFVVTSDVLDPRPETETLIAAALAMPFTSVLDLGTGSGCILLTLLAERPAASGVGIDLSEAALAVARRNASVLGVQADWGQGSWFDPVQGRYDLIVSNPPYIAAEEMSDLAPEVRQYEPHLALTPGGDGLDAYRIICAAAPTYLAEGGRMLVEIGPSQGAIVAGFFADAGFHEIKILRDIDGRDRVVSGRFFCSLTNEFHQTSAI